MELIVELVIFAVDFCWWRKVRKDRKAADKKLSWELGFGSVGGVTGDCWDDHDMPSFGMNGIARVSRR